MIMSVKINIKRKTLFLYKFSNISSFTLLSNCLFISGAFLLTPSHDLSLDKAANICDKLNFRGSFSLTKTATGILFKFSEPDDFQQVFRKGFHKVSFTVKISHTNVTCIIMHRDEINNYCNI